MDSSETAHLEVKVNRLCAAAAVGRAEALTDNPITTEEAVSIDGQSLAAARVGAGTRADLTIAAHVGVAVKGVVSAAVRVTTGSDPSVLFTADEDCCVNGTNATAAGSVWNRCGDGIIATHGCGSVKVHTPTHVRHCAHIT